MATKQFQNAKLNVTHLDLKDDASRSVLQSGENISHSLGKIARWYKDIIWTDSKATTEAFGIVKLSDDYKSESTETVPTSKTLNDVVKLIKQTGGWNTTYDFNLNIDGDENLQNGQFKVTEHDLEGDIDHYVSIKGLGSAAYTESSAYATAGHTHKYAGSASVGGPATSANKINTDAGSTANPVYFKNGIPVACTHSLNSTVPSDAVFTDTIYIIESGDSDGQIKITPSVGDPYNVSVKGLGSAAYTDSSDYATAGHTHNYAGSSTAGGVANSAAKLSDIPTAGIGSETKPVFFSGTTGRPVACTYSLNATVPANAIFTDEKVKQSPVTTDGSFEVLFAGSTGNTAKTEGVGKTTTLTFNPSTGALSATSFTGNGSGLTTLNASNISSGTLSINRLPGSAVTIGTYGPAAGGTLSHSGTFDIPDFTVDAKGRITGAHTRTFTLPAQYTHPTHTSKTSGLYKITVDSLGHVSGTAAVTKSDIPALDYVSSTTTRNPNVVLAGPASGTAVAAPTFRALVVADLPSSGATAGSYGPSANATPGYGSTFNVPYITIDAKGRVTSIENKTVKIPASDNTNTTYSLSGAYGSSSNTWVTTLTPSSGSATTSTVPTGSTSAYGLMKLYNGVDSTSTALAATANAVKTAYDKANHSHPYVKIRDNGYSYNNLASFYNGSTLKSYIRITVPKGSSTWTMCTLEITLKANYSSGLYGKILFHGNWSSSSDWNNLKAEITHNLGTGIKMYASDKTYIYISGHGSYATCTVDKMTIGDNAVNYDLSAVTIDQVDSLPSTYQTVSMTYYANYSITGHTHTKSQITDFPSSIKNPNALTVQGNGTASFTYDGSAAKTLNIKPGTGISVSSDTSGNITITNTSTNTDTKNTAGSTNTSSKIFLIGATSQAANPQTYSHDTAYVGTDGCLYSNSTKVSVEGHTHSYLPLAGGTMTGTIEFGAIHGIVQHQRSDSNYTSAITWLKGGTSQATYDPQIGQHNTGDTNGSITILPYPTDTSPWSSSVGLYISKTRLLFNGTSISLSGHTHNYAGSSTAGGVANSAAKLSTARTINGVKFDGTANIIVPRSIKHIHYANGTNGTSGYVKICTVGTNAAYGDQPIRITIGQRRISVYDIFIVFENSASAKATIRDAYFRSNRLAKQTPEVHYYLNSNGYYDIYVKKTESQDHIFIMDYLKSDGDEGDHVELTWTNTLVSTLPSGSVKMLNEMDKYYLSTISRGANTVLAAPNGSAGSATFRALVAADLPSSGATAGSYGPSANATPGYGATFNVPYITVDAKGRVTAISTKTVKIPASDNTNTTYTFATGDNSGTFKVTPSGGSATNIAIKGISHVAGDSNGIGMAIGAGGLTVLGSGESASALVTAASLSGTSETLYLTSDTTIGFYVNCQTISERKGITLNASLSLYPNNNNVGSVGTSANKWNTMYATTFHGALSGNATSASKIYSTNTPGSSSYAGYSIPFFDGPIDSSSPEKNDIATTGNKSVLHNSEFRLGLQEGTTSAAGFAQLVLGNGIASGTAGNKYGALSLYSTSAYAVKLVTANLTASRTITLPDATGTVALTNHTHSYLPLAGGTMTGDITFTGVSSTTYPALSNQIYFSGNTDWARILYEVTASDAGQLVFETGDDANAKIVFRNKVTSGGTYTRQVTIADGVISGNGSGLTSLNASNISSGTLSADRLATSGVKAGSYGPSANATPGYGSTFNVPYITVDNKGRVTAISTKTVKIPASDNTNTTYTFATGDNNGTFKVTPSGGSATNIAIKGLGSAAYTASSAYATSGHAHGLGHSNFTVAIDSTTNTWAAIGVDGTNKYVLKSIRTNTNAPPYLLNDFSAGIVFGGEDTRGVISMKYNTPSIRFAGGNRTAADGGTAVWYITLTGTHNTTYNLDTMHQVTQTATSTANFRGVILGTNNTVNTGDTRETTVTGQGYITNKIFAQPSTGNLYASNIYAFVNGTDEVRIALYRSGNSSWRFLNSGGTLSLQNNYYSDKVQSWYNVAQFDYGGTNAIKLMTPPQLTGTNRSTTYGYGGISIAICSKNSWAMGMSWLNNARNAVRGEFGAYGTANNLTYYYWGTAHNATKLRLYPTDNGGLVTQQANGFRMVNNGYGVIFRTDNTDFYILLTDKKTDGSELTGNNWNGKRPLRINLSSGICDINGSAYSAHRADFLQTAMLYSDASDANSKRYYRVAYATTTDIYKDINALFLITSEYGQEVGIIKVRARTEGTAGAFGSTKEIRWIINSGFTENIVKLVVKNNYNVDTAKTGTATAEVWLDNNTRYKGIKFTILSQGHRTGTTKVWTIKTNTSGGSTAMPTTGVTSTINATNKGISNNAATSTIAKTVYDIDASTLGDTIGIGYVGAGLTTSEALQVACFTSKATTQGGATRHIKDLSFANLKIKIGFDYETLFSGTAAASVGTGAITGYTRLIIFCKNTSNSSYFTVQLQATTGYHYHAMTVSPPPAAQTSNSFYGLLFNVEASKITVSAGKYSNLSSSASLANGPTVHITKVIGYKF